jgi:hypothetical protein
MSADVLVALLRLMLVVGLYLFLAAVALVLARSLWPPRATTAPAMQQSEAASPRARLVVVDAAQHGLPSEFAIEGDVVIGRDPACAVCLPPMFVSGRHARLEFSGGRWWIQDLGSRNKTYINGKEVPVDSPVPTSLGDEITVAGIKLQLSQP